MTEARLVTRDWLAGVLLVAMGSVEKGEYEGRAAYLAKADEAIEWLNKSGMSIVIEPSALPAAAPAEGLDWVPRFEIGQVVGELQPGRRRHDWCSEHGEIGSTTSVAQHLLTVHGMTYEQWQTLDDMRAAAPAEGLRYLLSEVANDYTEAHLNVTSHSGTLGTRIRAALARHESGSET